ncbi:GNAT family N-acetyltransferase [Marimonas arenosa]|uniref:GNAT family N-acetyltransferase n=1 Tax=Marimonas arenosa TaxID=1795305 RepID=A0AAE3W9B8_9RHOB|nr:GNAT family N-acetyltransferase [Marimonas arenosa]MDQ2088996.1 GNAT family N-acetyltransferase [Marimonas arenosa]
MTTTIIRLAQERDLAALGAMVGAQAAHHGDAAATSEDLRRRDILSNHPWVRVWVAEAQGRLVGYVACTRRVQMQFGKRGIDLHHLFVVEDRRGQGVGTALVDVARDWARDEACSVVMVGTEPGNIRAQRFYLGLSFQQVTVEGVRFVLPVEAR